MKSGTKLALWLGFSLLIPLIIQAATAEFMIVFTLREPLEVKMKVENNPSTMEAFMENFDAAAVYVATIYLSTGEDATALVAFSEDTITAYNENDQKHKVKTFSQVSGTDRNRFFVGGYLPSDGGSASGSYTSEATVQVLFQ